MSHGIRVRAAIALLAAALAAPSTGRAMGMCFSTYTPTVQLSVSPASPAANGSAIIACTANPNGGSVASLNVSVSGGTLGATAGTTASIAGASGQVTWNTPAGGSYAVQCSAVPGSSCTLAASAPPVSVTVSSATAPIIDSLSGPAGPILAGQTVTITAAAHDPAGGALSYQWSATGGTISGQGPTASWTAPQLGGGYVVSVTVTGASGSSTSSISLGVALAVYRGPAAWNIRSPSRVAVAASRQVFAVVDGRDGRVLVYGANGGLLGGAALPERALAVAAAGSSVFASTVSGRLYRVDLTSGRAAPVPLRDGLLSTPAGLSFDAATGLLWVAERTADQVRALRQDGTTAMVLRDAAGAALGAPIDVAVQPTTGLVWVALQSSEAGNLLFAFGSATGAYVGSYVTFAQLTRAGGLAASAERIYVSDIFQGQIQVVTTAGALLGSVASYGGGAGQVRSPSGLGVAPNGDLLVANNDLGRIDRFGSGAPLPPVCYVNGQVDSDCDGMPDWWEVRHGLNPFWAGDAFLPWRHSRLTNLQRFLLETTPGGGTGDDGEGDDDAPVLVASGPRASDPGLVRLSASLKGPAGCAIAWSQRSGPARVALIGGATLSPSFIARAAGAYVFEAVAKCGSAVSSPVRVATTIRNVPPRPDAGRTQVLEAGERARLDGGFSSDANGDPLSLSWEQSLGRPVAGATPGQALAVRTEAPGLYAFDLTATDPAGASASSRAEVLALDDDGPGPTAVAATPVLGRVGSRVALDASASYLPRGADARYSWTQLEGPAAALEGQGTARPSFVPAAPGRHLFELNVAAGGLRSPTARVEVFVAPAGAGLPTADAKAPSSAMAGDVVALDGSGSAAAAGGTLAWAWRQVAGPAAGLTDADRPVASVVPFSPGSYAFELTVSEGDAASVPARARIDVGAPGVDRPLAVASGPGTVYSGQKIRLDGSGSAGAPGRLLRWRWTQVAGPWVALEGAGGPKPELRAGAPGVYTFELEVDDGSIRSAPASVSVLVLAAGGDGEVE